MQNRKLITVLVVRRLYQGEAKKGKEVLYTAAFRARTTRALDGGDAIVQPWHEAVDAAAGEQKWLIRHPAAMSQQQRESSVASKRL